MNPFPVNPSHGDTFELNGHIYTYWDAPGGGGWMQAIRPTVSQAIAGLQRMRAELSR